MSLLGGLNPVSLLATAALGPAGGILAQLAQQVVSQLGQELLGQLGQDLGLPQTTIDMAKGTFTSAIGDQEGTANNLQDAVEDFSAAQGLSPSEIGDQQRQVSDFINDTIKQARESSDYNEATGTGKASGWLMAMAKVLGAQLDKLGDQMTDMASKITKDTPGLSAQFSVVTQQFSMLMNATENGIKTVGEAMGKAAQKN